MDAGDNLAVNNHQGQGEQNATDVRVQEQDNEDEIANVSHPQPVKLRPKLDKEVEGEIFETRPIKRCVRSQSERISRPNSFEQRRNSKEDQSDKPKLREKFKVIHDRLKAATRFQAVSKPAPSSPKSKKQKSDPSDPQESAFRRQVVKYSPEPVRRKCSFQRPMSKTNPMHVMDPSKKASFISHIPQARRALSPNFVDIETDSKQLKQRIVKVMKARLYLLQQTGPNVFLIGGDSPNHKYKVTIGTQGCSCSKAQSMVHCVHVLFVMLRVFQLDENDPMLSRTALKNYEVDALFNKFHERRSSLIQNLSKKKKKKKGKEESSEDEDHELDRNIEQEAQGLPEEAVSIAQEEEGAVAKIDEEQVCSICLLEMVEGESLTECINGCQNKLHHHCLTIWFEECRRQKEPLICPLCRAKWHVDTEVNDLTAGIDDLPVPPNTRVSSPQNVLTDADQSLPQAEPLHPENREIAQPWIPIVGEELVACIFSKNWKAREAGVRQLGRVAVSALLLGLGEGRTGIALSEQRVQTTHDMLECALQILAYVLADPVYKVFVAGLRTLRIVLSYTPCRTNEQRERIQMLMRPVVHSILLKCADSIKRTSQLSISALQELAKGQNGELAVGKEIANPGTTGYGGLEYLLDCMVGHKDEAPSLKDGGNWQWLLGRLVMLLKLLEVEEHLAKFIVHPQEDIEDNGDMEQYVNFNRVISVLEFACPALDNPHQKVGRMARRVFYWLAKLQAHNSHVLKCVIDQLEGVDLSLQIHLKRRLLKMANEFQIAKRQAIPRGLTPSDSLDTEDDEGDILDSSLSSSSPSTPRKTNSDPSKPSQPIKVTVNNYVTGNVHFMPLLPDVGSSAPPNSPRRKFKRQVSVHDEASFSNMGGQAEMEVSVELNETSPLVPENTLESTTIESEEVESQDTTQTEISVDNFDDDDPNGPISTSSRIASAYGTPTKQRITPSDISMSPTLKIRGLPSGRSSASSSKTTNRALPLQLTSSDDEVFSSPTLSDRPAQNGPARVATEHDPGQAIDPDSLSQCSISATAASSSGSLAGDLSNMTFSPSALEEGVSFRTEVTAGSPLNTQPKAEVEEEEEVCPCKEEVELEEAKALVAAMEQSALLQNELPHVPGLSREKEETLTIRIQNEDGTGDGPESYLEGVDWKRGVMLGTGAFSTCYQARDVKTGVLMAVKQISFCRNSLAEQETVIEAVREEIHMMSQLNHPNVVRICGATQQGCHFFMFVEWMPGGSVAHLLHQYGEFEQSVIVNYTQQILRGLAYLHENHLLHRDLKGANLLVDSTGQRVRIADFGASARLASRTTGAGEFQGQLLGTIAFMAPEVLRGESYGRSCDVWSVGCVVIEMATKKPPWGASDVSNHLALIFKIASCQEPPPIPENLSPPLRDLVLRCLECNRDYRPPAKELLEHPVFTMAR